jgi:hypothetical protein
MPFPLSLIFMNINQLRNPSITKQFLFLSVFFSELLFFTLYSTPFVPIRITTWITCSLFIPPHFIQNNHLDVDLFFPHLKSLSCTSHSQLIHPERVTLVLSLTSLPARSKFLTIALYSMLTQTYHPDIISLWLSTRDFPNQSLTAGLLKMEECNNFMIQFVDDDNFGPALKLIPALKAFPDAVIITLDDDVFYRSNQVEQLIVSYSKNKSFIHCHRGKLVPLSPNGVLQTGHVPRWKTFWAGLCGAPVSKLIMAQGVGGILYPPHSLDKRVFQNKLFYKLCPTHDDLWFWVMAILHGTRIMVIKTCSVPITLVGEKGMTLFERNCRRMMYHKQTVRVFQHFEVSKLLVEDRQRFADWYSDKNESGL